MVAMVCRTIVDFAENFKNLIQLERMMQ